MNILSKILFTLLLGVISSSVMATEFDVAHINQQGQNMIVIPLNSNAQYKSDQQLNELMYLLQKCATSAGLAGTVVIVWTSNNGMMFMGPRQWQNFLRSIDMLWVAKNINRTLTCY